MALPRWVCSETVDSAAALTGYYRWYAKLLETREHEDIIQLYGIGDGGLRLIYHVPEVHAVDDGTALVTRVECPMGHRCRRCRLHLGGYLFRWLSPYWMETYRSHARRGAWMPGDPEFPITITEYARKECEEALSGPTDALATDSFGWRVTSIEDLELAVAQC